MRVVVVAEYYPRKEDPVLGVWAHRQAMAARDAGADVRVIVLHRPVPPKAALKRPRPRALRQQLDQPAEAVLDGIPIRYVRYLSPPRGRWYGTWGAWAAPLLERALTRLEPFDLIHAHYAAPAGDAVKRARPQTPLVVSVHGGDVLSLAQTRNGGPAVRGALEHARLTLANSNGTERRARALGATDTRVVHLGTDLPPTKEPPPARPRIVTVGHLVARKRHEDVAHALTVLPEVEWIVVGDGPRRRPLEALARKLGISGRVTFTGQLPPLEAQAHARAATAFVLPSVDEAFGVAYIEAMAGGVPAIGTRHEDGPEEIASAGCNRHDDRDRHDDRERHSGMLLVPPMQPRALAQAIREAIDRRDELGQAARETVERHFTWERCGERTVRAYEDALR